MTQKTGRNDPCPCGSGKKYKQCCGKPQAPEPAAPDSHEGAARLALTWLETHHRKAFAAALRTEIDEVAIHIFDGDEDAARDALASLDQDAWQSVQINLIEWLMAEGGILVKMELTPVSELLLGPNGPLLTIGQRAWLEQLARQPLRLYDLTDVVPGVGVTVCDALATDAAPLVVTERAGSRSLKAGMQVGARVMEAGGQHQFSGGIYPFTVGDGRAVHAELRDQADGRSRKRADGGTAHDEDAALIDGLIIVEAWLAQQLLPEPLPTLIDSQSGDPMLFTTDYYAVHDWDALAAALAARPDVEGDRQAGWNRLQDCDDGQTRSQAAINIEPDRQRVGVFYNTAVKAKQGRAWFDALVGDSVTFQLREVSDPKEVMARASAQPTQGRRTSAMPEGFDANTLGDFIETALKRHYANWPDEPIPALGGRTPRQAILNVQGMERVKGLLRSYEDGEVQQAAQQGRREFSYQFLWDALGLKR